MVEVDVLSVFTDEDGGGGNLLGVVLDGAAVPPGARQALAAEFGYSETVYVDDVDRVAIFTPEVELPFAGHPLVGAAWLMVRNGAGRATLHTGAGEVPVSHRGEEVFIAGRPEWAPQFDLIELGTPAEVDALRGPPAGHDLVTAWSWIDAEAGIVRVRVFPARFGIDEDEATGANAILMAGRLDRRLLLRQGVASRICAAPVGDGYVEVGGFVKYVSQNSVTVPDAAQLPSSEGNA
ncbi:MAG TPA: PhzF family phenazine biosynthesis protein [Solirubrobacteraceae bacterium]